VALLQLDADPGSQSGPVGPRVEPEHPDPAGVGHPDALQAFHRRCLARAVRADDAEDLALLDRERDVAHGVPRAVPLAHGHHVDDCHARRR
jgi:hypothetical protein